MRTWKHYSYQALEPINEEGETNESPQWIKDPKPLPEDESEAGDLQEKLESTLNKLPVAYRTTLSLIDVQEFNYKEAAFIMGISIGTVKSRLARGRMQFRQIWNGLNTQDALTVSKTKGEYHVNYNG